jgi:hypothetical protein
MNPAFIGTRKICDSGHLRDDRPDTGARSWNRRCKRFHECDDKREAESAAVIARPAQAISPDRRQFD